LQQSAANNWSILFEMKAVLIIVALALGAVVLLYFLVMNFVPEGRIVGFHFRWPWRK
jgi:hypothetical protein